MHLTAARPVIEQGPDRLQRSYEVLHFKPSIPDRDALDDFCCESCRHNGRIGCKTLGIFCASNLSIPARGVFDSFCYETRHHTKAQSDAKFLRGFALRVQASLMGVHLTLSAAKPSPHKCFKKIKVPGIFCTLNPSIPDRGASAARLVTTKRPDRMQSSSEVLCLEPKHP